MWPMLACFWLQIFQPTSMDRLSLLMAVCCKKLPFQPLPPWQGLKPCQGGKGFLSTRTNNCKKQFYKTIFCSPIADFYFSLFFYSFPLFIVIILSQYHIESNSLPKYPIFTPFGSGYLIKSYK